MPTRWSRLADGVMEAGWLLALIVTPLFFNIYSSRVFEPDKIALLRSLALIVLAAWLVKVVASGDAVRATGAGMTFSGQALLQLLRVPLLVPIVALILVYLLSTLWSVSVYTSLFGSYQRMQGTFTTFSYLVLFAAVAANLRERAQVERILTTVVVTSLPISLYGILQRYRLDPLPWGGDTTQRVTANMGNAIFLAAYLIMSTLIVLGRVVTNFRHILVEGEHLKRNVARATCYVFILAVNLVAIWFTGSRGPWLGLLAGAFFFFVLLALHWRVRWLALGTIGLAALLAVFLVLLNVPGGPLESVRSVPSIGRLGRVFETDEGTGRVRVLIWRGVVDLMRPHAPLEYPEGGIDRWNALRPLIGYGPEALYVAFNRFYPPELGQIEARNASPDRSHNETFDALAFTGLLGLGVYLAVFVAVFYYGLKWLGLIDLRASTYLFLGLVLGSGAASAAGFVVWRGAEFFGVGLPFGMLLGLIAFLTLYALRPVPRDQATAGIWGSASAPEAWRAIALISLFSAVVAHFGEIHFGIAIVSTRTHFWLFTALMMVLGYALTRPQASGAAAAPAPGTSRRRQRASGARAASAAAGIRSRSTTALLISAGLMSALLVTLGFDFINNRTRTTEASRIVLESLTTLPTPQGSVASYAILGLMLMTWIIGGTVIHLEETLDSREPGRWDSLLGGLGLAGLAGGVSWLLLAGQLGRIAAPTAAPTTFEQVVQQVLTSATSIAGVLTLYAFLLLLVLLGLAWVFSMEWPSINRAASPGVWAAATVLPLAALYLSVALNLRVVQADVIYKTGLQFDDEGRPQIAISLYQKSIELTPGQDYYYLFLGRSFLNATGALADPQQRDSLLAQAEAELKVARTLNPLNTDHTANLGRLNRQWAALATDPAVRAQRAAEANAYYEQALRLSPNNAGLWNEWALLAFQVLDDPDGAQAKVTHSLSLDPKFEQTYQIQGDLYVWRATQATDAGIREAAYRQAIEAYAQAITAAEARGSDTLNMRIGLAGAYAATSDLPRAIQEYVRVAEQNAGLNQWKVYRALAELYRQTGDVAQAASYGQRAVEAAPEAERSGLEAWLSGLIPSP